MSDGLIACIALWLGPPDLLDRVVAGPSSVASLQVTSLHASNLYPSDNMEPEDIQALYGTVHDPTDGTLRSWFPAQQNMEYCGFWRGEWTEALEVWFSARVNSLRDRSEHTKPSLLTSGL